MKLETQEKIRLVELLAGLAISCGLILTNREHFLDNYTVIQGESFLALSPYLINFITSIRQEMYTKEYKEIKELYDRVVDNTTLLMHEVGLEDPVQIFATYMYLYRHGYLSLNKEFSYKNDMKDFAKLGGVDVIRGKGVCRSVSAMFTDISNHMDLKATNLTVAINGTIPKIETLCDKGKGETDAQTKKLVKKVVAITEHLSLANHQITMVEGNNTNYIFDVMNDGFLQKGDKNKLLLANDPSAHMKIFNGQYLAARIMGNVETIDLVSLQKQLALPTIDYEEYKQIYLDTLHFCQNNIELFENFYQENQELYKEIDNASEKQSNNLIRMFGFGPIEKQLKKIKK